MKARAPRGGPRLRLAPCGDAKGFHSQHCQPVPREGESLFSVTVWFENCPPGQQPMSALALEEGHLDRNPGAALLDLRKAAGRGNFDEVVFDVAWDAGSENNMKRRYPNGVGMHP